MQAVKDNKQLICLTFYPQPPTFFFFFFGCSFCAKFFILGGLGTWQEEGTAFWEDPAGFQIFCGLEKKLWLNNSKA